MSARGKKTLLQLYHINYLESFETLYRHELFELKFADDKLKVILFLFIQRQDRN